MRQPSCITHIAGLIVAGGYSSRMGSFKPLLPLGERTVLETAVGSLRKGGIQDIRVVIGYRAEELIPMLEALQVTIVVNEKYDNGMFSSVVAGVSSLVKECEAFLLLPGDIPLIRQHSIRELLHAYRRTRGSVIYPVFRAVRGHPPLIASECFAHILNGTGEGGLRAVLAGFEDRSIEVELADQGILVDIDMPEDYQRLQKMMLRRDIPSPEECLALLHKYQAGNEKLLRHGQKVAGVALKMAVLLTNAGLHLDKDLLSIGGLIHDLAKGKPNHAERGKRWLACREYPALASLVGAHMDLQVVPEALPDEKALLFLADKLVKGDKVVTLEERFAPALQRFAQEPVILAKILQKKRTAEVILQQIQKLTGAVNIKIGAK